MSNRYTTWTDTEIQDGFFRLVVSAPFSRSANSHAPGKAGLFVLVWYDVLMNKHQITPERLIELEEQLAHRLEASRNSALEKFPFLFLILTTFGTVTTLTGFQKFLTQVGWLNNNPLVVLGVGLVTLFFTGALYKKLA